MKNPEVLVTGGPVWAPIDSVRVITNIFTGTLGFLIAKEAARRGFKTTLLLGPSAIVIPKKSPKNLEIVRFRFFDELYREMENRIKSQNYKFLFNSAAIADYVPVQKYNGKIKSGKEDFSIKLKPTTKIVDQVKKWDPNIFLVKFKLEVGLPKDELLTRAYDSMLHSKAELIVANDTSEMKDGKHRAYIIDQNKKVITCDGKEEIAKKLIDLIKGNNP